MKFVLQNLDGQQSAWVRDAIAHASIAGVNLSDIKPGADQMTVYFQMVTEPSAPGHNDVMCTSHPDPTYCLTEIRARSDDPTAPFLQGLPNPAQDVKPFFMESIIHELVHAIHEVLITTDDQITAIAACFVKQGNTGEGMKVGTLADWASLGLKWEDRIEEAVAEVLKDALLPSEYRVYDNRTNWEVAPGKWQTLTNLMGFGLNTPGTPGTPGVTFSPQIGKLADVGFSYAASSPAQGDWATNLGPWPTYWSNRGGETSEKATTVVVGCRPSTPEENPYGFNRLTSVVPNPSRVPGPDAFDQIPSYSTVIIDVATVPGGGGGLDANGDSIDLDPYYSGGSQTARPEIAPPGPDGLQYGPEVDNILGYYYPYSSGYDPIDFEYNGDDGPVYSGVPRQVGFPTSRMIFFLRYDKGSGKLQMGLFTNNAGTVAENGGVPFKYAALLGGGPQQWTHYTGVNGTPVPPTPGTPGGSTPALNDPSDPPSLAAGQTDSGAIRLD